jgi:hypothetical protein
VGVYRADANGYVDGPLDRYVDSRLSDRVAADLDQYATCQAICYSDGITDEHGYCDGDGDTDSNGDGNGHCYAHASPYGTVYDRASARA